MTEYSQEQDDYNIFENVISLEYGRERRDKGLMPRRYKLKGMLAKRGSDRQAIQKGSEAAEFQANARNCREDNNASIKRSLRLGKE